MSKITVIGSGFSGLASASYLAKAGHSVTIVEKNSTAGGRGRHFSDQGFMFDMGPSWYWMPDVFERFYNNFGKTTSDFYDLKKLDPGFQMIFGTDDVLAIPENKDALINLFESIEKGSGAQLIKFLNEAAYKYDISMQNLIYQPSLSWMEFVNKETLGAVFNINILTSYHKYIRSFFKDPRLIALMEFPVLFLGGLPKDIPALYSLMNHAAFTQGTFYPMGGMYKIIEAMSKVALEQGVDIKLNHPVSSIDVSNGKTNHLTANNTSIAHDYLVASADYHHVEQQLLPKESRRYTEKFWDKQTLAPSCLIFYVGVSKRLKRLEHHNLFFDASFEKHGAEMYTNPQWPTDPLFYLCAPSVTDSSVAPIGHENLFILIPIASDLKERTDLHEGYFENTISRVEKFIGEKFKENIVYKKSFSISDFQKDYNAYKGNAYGHANTLLQTAVFKPSIVNPKVKNMYYTGQLTVPGPGVPPSLISGKIVAEQIIKQTKN